MAQTGFVGETGEGQEGQPPPAPGGIRASAPPPPFNPAALQPLSAAGDDKRKDAEKKAVEPPKELSSEIAAGQVALAALGMTGHKADLYLILDISTSMQVDNHFYDKDKDSKGGSECVNQIQLLINKALSMGLLIAADQRIKIIPFGKRAYDPIEVDSSNFKEAANLVFQKVVATDQKDGIASDAKEYLETEEGKKLKPNERLMWMALQRGTEYAKAVQKLRKHCFGDDTEQCDMQPTKKPPVFALFVTDGEPSDDHENIKKIFGWASHQAIFFKLIALKGRSKLQFELLDGIQKGRGADFCIQNMRMTVLDIPENLTMEMMFDGYPSWLHAAYNERMLINRPGVDPYFASKKDSMTVAGGEHQGFEKLKIQLVAALNAYIGWYKLRMFGYKHHDRATVVRDKIAASPYLDYVKRIVDNQYAILRGDNEDAKAMESVLDRRWSAKSELQNSRPKAEIEQSGYYLAIKAARELLEEYMGHGKQHRKSLDHK